MSEHFFDRPVLNSPYEYPARHWELDESGQPTGHILDRRRLVSLITPIPKPRRRNAAWANGAVSRVERGQSGRACMRCAAPNGDDGSGYKGRT